MPNGKASARAAERRGTRAAIAPLDVAGLAERMAPWRDASRLLLAVSGGPDSIALMGLGAEWARCGGPPLAVATVDHHLRAESRCTALAVVQAAAGLGIPGVILEWRGPPPASRIQERARAGRYALLVGHARAIGASHLVTAHTLDDQAETILFRLARGSGTSGLVGMRACVRRGGIAHVRPLLDVRKASLVATCRAKGWPFFEDPANADPRFARTRWRRVLRELEPEGLGPERLAALSQRLERLEAAVDTVAQATRKAVLVAREDGKIVFDGRALAEVPAEIFLRVLTSGLHEVARGEAAGHLRLQRLERLCRELQGATQVRQSYKGTLGGAIVVAQANGEIVLTREPPRRRSNNDAAPGAGAD